MRNMHQSTVFLTEFPTLGSTGPAKGGHEGEKQVTIFTYIYHYSTKWVFSNEILAYICT